jgi:hypothetical protein
MKLIERSTMFVYLGAYLFYSLWKNDRFDSLRPSKILSGELKSVLTILLMLMTCVQMTAGMDTDRILRYDALESHSFCWNSYCRCNGVVYQVHRRIHRHTGRSHRWEAIPLLDINSSRTQHGKNDNVIVEGTDLNGYSSTFGYTGYYSAWIMYNALHFL